MRGFPERKVTLVPLKTKTKGNPHVEWLAASLRELKPNEKVLLICSTKERASRKSTKPSARRSMCAWAPSTKT